MCSYVYTAKEFDVVMKKNVMKPPAIVLIVNKKVVYLYISVIRRNAIAY